MEQWTEQDVLDWLFTLQDGQLAEYAMLFERHHINGRSLFLLKEEDLLQIGLLSLGHRKQLMEELDKLKHDSHRLLHFPPLQHHKPKVSVSVQHHKPKVSVSVQHHKPKVSVSVQHHKPKVSVVMLFSVECAPTNCHGAH